MFELLPLYIVAFVSSEFVEIWEWVRPWQETLSSSIYHQPKIPNIAPDENNVVMFLYLWIAWPFRTLWRSQLLPCCVVRRRRRRQCFYRIAIFILVDSEISSVQNVTSMAIFFIFGTLLWYAIRTLTAVIYGIRAKHTKQIHIIFFFLSLSLSSCLQAHNLFGPTCHV